MSGFTAIDLSQLPLPDAVETLDAETILAGLKARLIGLAPELSDVAELESEPVVKLLEVTAWCALMLRARVNDAVRAVHLASATGTDLDQLAALFGVARLVVAPGDPAAVPPVAATLEADGDLRLRAQLALEGFSTAGPVGAYQFHARSADARVKDVSVTSPAPGEVRVCVLSSEGTGAASAEVLTAVAAALNAEDVRPLCDTVTVIPATIAPYTIEAAIEYRTGPDVAVVRASAEAALASHVASVHALGIPVARSGILAALHRPGVTRVTLTAPAADLLLAPTAAGWCSAIALTVTEAA